MKYLKNYKIFEFAIIKPLKVDTLIDRLIQESPQTIEEANEISNEYNIDIVSYDTFMDSIDDDMAAGAPPRSMFTFGNPSTGFHFAVMNKFTSKMNLVVVYDDFIKFLNSRRAPMQLLKVIKSILGHESIHYQQYDKMGKDPSKYVVESPVKNHTGYLKHHTEVMAFAFSVVDELKNVEGNSKDEILSILKKGKGHRILDDYHRLFSDKDKKTYKKFIKYAYQYVEELFNEEVK